MRKTIPLLLCAAIATAFSFGAVARGAAGGGGFSHGSPGGPSSDSKAFENSNGRFSQDRDKGLDRADDRKSGQGLRHGKATGAKNKRHPGAAERAATR